MKDLSSPQYNESEGGSSGTSRSLREGDPLDQAVHPPRDAELSHTWLRASSGDDDCRIHCWSPSQHPRGMVVLFHGLGGHGMFPTVRYLAELLVRHHFCVYSGDFCGHGQSPGLAGYIASPDVLLEDARQMIKFARQRHPTLLIFLGGVSMGGAVAILLSIELKSCISGMLLVAPMVKLDLPEWQHWALHNLHLLSNTLALFKPPTNYAEFQFRDADRRQEAEEDPYAYKGGIRIASALTCVALCSSVTQQLQEITTPFLALMATEDTVIDNAGIDDLMEQASSTDKSLKEYAALHGLVCEEEPLRSEIERDIVQWLIERTSPGHGGGVVNVS